MTSNFKTHIVLICWDSWSSFSLIWHKTRLIKSKRIDLGHFYTESQGQGHLTKLFWKGLLSSFPIIWVTSLYSHSVGFNTERCIFYNLTLTLKTIRDRSNLQAYKMFIWYRATRWYAAHLPRSNIKRVIVRNMMRFLLSWFDLDLYNLVFKIHTAVLLPILGLIPKL